MNIVWIVLFSSLFTYGYVPIEDVIIGSVVEENKLDPLEFIFYDFYHYENIDEIRKIKLYQHKINDAENLKRSCSYLGSSFYGADWQEKQAKRSVVATLQWLGLDLSVKAIGALSQKLNLQENDFSKMSTNLVQNYCSKNISVISLKSLEKKLKDSFENPDPFIIPSVNESPFASQYFKDSTSGENFHSKQLDYAIKVFRSFCSWSSDVDDYRLIAPYLKHPIIMSYLYKNLLGFSEDFNVQKKKVVDQKSSHSLQVICEELICRKTTKPKFDDKFPISIGSTGLFTDLSKLYCQHFRFQEYQKKSEKLVNQWLKEMEIEEPIFETNFFISLITGVPEPLIGMEKYTEIPFLLKSSIDERWDQWSKKVLSLFSKDLFFEESLRIKLDSAVPDLRFGVKSFSLKLHLTLGDLDAVLKENDKFKVRLLLNIPKNYLIQTRVKWRGLIDKIDLDGQKKLKKDFADFLAIQLKQKDKYFLQKIFTPELSALLVDDLLLQSLTLRGNLLDDYSNEVLQIPLDIYYGPFALSYLKYKTELSLKK